MGICCNLLRKQPFNAAVTPIVEAQIYGYFTTPYPPQLMKLDNAGKDNQALSIDLDGAFLCLKFSRDC